jgi:hypothetical protein
MKLSELRDSLARNPESTLGFQLPDGSAIRADFHVTEVGHVTKRFIDCGGKTHSSEACILQVWLADNDKEHRLMAGKLASILELAKPVMPAADLDVEIEYEKGVVSQYPVASIEAAPGRLEIKLSLKHTDCLAREACGLDQACCGTEGCC